MAIQHLVEFTENETLGDFLEMLEGQPLTGSVGVVFRRQGLKGSFGVELKAPNLLEVPDKNLLDVLVDVCTIECGGDAINYLVTLWGEVPSDG